ncbi:[protein-PII] uridylyltransferase [Nitrospinota bacterium]
MAHSLRLIFDLKDELLDAVPAASRWERDAFLRHIKETYARGITLLADAHREGSGGLEVCEARALFMDALLCQLWGHGVRGLESEEGASSGSASCAMVAIGGYGRGELSPGSDIDLMFVFPKRSPLASRLVRIVLYLLWDAGLDIGHSARTISECIRIAREDYQSETSMLENRLISGDQDVFEEFNRRFDSYLKRVSKSAHLRRRLRDRSERYRSWDPSVYVQEPNIKEGAGGLRDLHIVLWLARPYGAKKLDGIWQKGWASKDDCEKVREAYDFLLRIRTELHVQSGSKNDMLTFPAQADVAPALGYKDTELAMASEALMRDYFMRARTMHIFCRDLFERLEEDLKNKGWARRRPHIEPLGGGLALRDYHSLILDGSGDEVLNHPEGLMRVFELQFRYSSALSAEMRNFIRSSLDSVGETFRSSAEVRDSFFRILEGKAGVARTLREMHGLGFLGRYIPEFGDLTCFVQYDHYHRYTADEHTLLTIQFLDNLAYTKEMPLQELAHVHREMERCHILRLALLLHDIGKVRGTRHDHRSVAALPEITVRLGLPADEGRVLEFLVANHLEMSHIAERRDIDDPGQVERFAEKVETVEQLKMLYLLSYGDINAVAPGMWTEWRGTLIYELYRRTLRVLESGEAVSKRKRLDEIGSQVCLEARAAASKVDAANILKHLENMPERYRMGTAPQDILHQIEMSERLDENTPFVMDVTHRRRLGNTLLTLVCEDRLGLFALVAGVFASFHVKILDAKAFTDANGLVVDTFVVVDSEGKAVTDDVLWENVRSMLSDLLSGKMNIEELMAKNSNVRHPKQRTHFEIPTLVEYDLTASEDETVLEVITPDRHGLLTRIAGRLAKEGVSISRAKISTEGLRAVDVFYVTNAQGRKIDDKARLRDLCEALTSDLAEESPQSVASI